MTSLLAVGLGVLIVAFSSLPAFAQSTLPLDAYLHGSGATTNPPTLTVDLLPSISLTAKTKDSPALNFSSGNPWQVIGNWTPPTGSTGSFTITGVGPSHLWTGLKGSADIGAKIDLQTEVLINGTVISTGLTRCISNLTASSSTPVDVSVALGAIPVTSINAATHTLAIRVSARMGTNTNGTACGTKSSVTGVRVYFEALTRLSRLGVTIQTPPPTPVAVIPNPLSIKTGTTASLTAILFPISLQTSTLTLTSSRPSIATVPSSITVAPGQLFVSIPVTGVSAGATQITATMNGRSATSTVQVTGGVATVTSLTPPSLSITQGGAGTLTVTLNAIQSTNTTVTLTSSLASVASVPASVTVPAGQLTAPVTVAANTAGQADITASLNGTSATSHITVTPSLPTVVALQPSTSQVVVGASTTLTVTISSAQTTNTAVTLITNPNGVVSVPATVVVPANQTQASFTVTALTLGTAFVHASLNASSTDAVVDVVPPALQLTALQPPSQSIVVGATGSLSITINAQQSTPTDIALTVDNPAVLTVPPTVTVQPNQLVATFTVIGKTTGLATITATLGTVTKTATVTVTPQPPQVAALLPPTLNVVQGATGTITLSINAAQVGDTTVPLTNTNPAILNVPPTAIVPAGQTSVAIPVAGLTLGNATVTALLNGTVSSTISVVPPPVLLTSLAPIPPGTTPLTLAKGRAGLLLVTVGRAPTDPTVVTLSNATPNLITIPATVTVQAGQLTAEVPISTQNEGTASLTASLNGSTASTQVIVTAPEVDALTLSPLAPSLFAGEAIGFVPTAILTDGATQPLTTGVTWTSTNTAVATIDTTGLATTLTAGTTTIKAATTNSLGPVTSETLLTVQPAPALTLTPTVATLLVGQATTLTITSGAPAPTGGLLVTLMQTGTGSVTVVGSATIPGTQSTVQVVVSGASPGLVTVTGTAVGRTPGTTQFTVHLPPPTITGFTPANGTIGTVVTLTGTNFGSIAQGGSTVRFNGTAAVATSVTPTSITTTVPLGATTGMMSVQTAGGTASSATPFTVQNAIDFSLAPVPAAVSIARVGNSTYQIKVTNTGPSPFTGFVNLNVTGLPVGVTGSFNPPQATVNQPSTLLLTSTSTSVPGAYPVTITGSGVVDGGVAQRTTQVQLTILPSGTSTLSGRVVASKDNAPIPNVTVKLNALSAITDAGGNFLLQNVPSGPQIVFLDGATASSGPVLYPIVPIPVTILSGQNNVLPWPAYLHEMSQDYTPINPSQDTLVTDAKVPNFMLRIPAGAQIIGWDGQPNTRVAVTVVPIERNALAPFPDLGDGKRPTDLFLFNFGKPGGGNPTQPIPIIFPNTWGNDPGTVADLYYYDESLTPDANSNQWKMFGQGRVSADGTKIIPDPGVGIPKFCCGGGGARVPPPPPPPDPDPLPTGTDPVILTTGQFINEMTDLVLPGRIPVVIQRAYRSPESGFSPVPTLGLFGRRTTLLNYNETLRLSGTQALAYVTNFGRALLAQQADGTFSTATSTRMRGLVATRNLDGSAQIRLKDGTQKLFDANGFLVAIKDRNGNQITILRDGAGRISEIREPAGRAITVQYDIGNRITQLTDPIGRTVQYIYDGQGRLSQVRNSEGGTTTYTYDSADRILTITDARGITYLTNEYDVAGRVVRQTQVDTGVWTLAYTVTAGRVTQTVITDPRGNPTIHRFNAQGGEVETVDALGQPTRRTFDFATNLLMEVRDPLNRLTKFTYDPAGNVSSILDPQGNTTLLEYETTFNRVTKITDALAQVTRFAYDPSNGNLLSTTDPLNHQTTISYNEFGQPTAVQGPIATDPPTTFAYDTNGNMAATIDPLGNKTQRLYDAVSRLIALTDPRGKSTQFQYDKLNQVTQITDAINGLTGFTYDPNGNLLTVADAKSQTTVYIYDNMDRLATRKDPLNRIESYQYDLVGNLTTFTDRKGQVATFQYDALNRRTSATYADATTTFTYDAAGRLTKTSDTAPGAGTIDFAYDILDRLIQETTPQGTVAYQYDVLGRRTQMVANGQQPTSYQYDAASRLTRVAQGSLFAALGYDNANRRTSLSYSNNTTTSYAYDLASRLTSITHNGPSGIIDALTYTYDAAGNRFSVNRANGIASLLPNAVASAAYDTANEQTQFAGENLTYDANGNLTSDGVNTYQWDVRNRLIGVIGGTTASFIYDGLGRRTSKAINGVASQFLYDRNDIVAEIGGGMVGASYLRSLRIDEPFVRQSDDNQFYHRDALGSTLALSDLSASMLVTYSYEPFGRVSANGVSANPFVFTGRELDSGDHYYYRARYYNSQTQRFMSPDPLLCGATNLPIHSIKKKPQTLNAFAYVNNSPGNFSDPLGLSPDCTYYSDRCFQVKSTFSLAYYCGAASYMCQNTGDNPWTNCVRQCLQDFDRDICSQLPSGRKDPFGVATACSLGPGHGYCFTACAAQRGTE